MTIKVNGFEMQATQMQGSDSYWVKAAECAKVARKIIKPLCPGASVQTTKGTGSLRITLPAGTPALIVGQVHQAVQWLAGESFDGMSDSRTANVRTAHDGNNVYLGSSFVFVNRLFA